MNRVNVIEKDYAVFINNPNHFLAISDLTDSDGINIVENVNIIKSNNSSKVKKESVNQEKRQYITQETNSLNYFRKSYGDIVLYTFLENDVIIQDFTGNLQVANSPKGFEDAKINISHVIYIKKILSKKDLLKIYKLISKTKAKYLADKNLPVHISNILNNDDFLAVLSDVPQNDEYEFDEYDIDEPNIKNAIVDSLDEAFKRFNLTFGILDHLVSKGILIGDLIEAGMELIHGDDASQEFEKKLEAQIFKSLEDINVITMLMVAIRAEQDFTYKRIRELADKDESSILYADEILGLSVANQIGGTKATFNFNQYYNLKPGILYGLPPVLNDVFAGFIAGCVSKVLEE